MFAVSASHFQVCKIRVRKAHVRVFLAYTGAAFMVADASIATAAHHIAACHSVEGYAAHLGKLGAAMSGCVAFFQDLFNEA
jgi:hypothetical protein